MSVYRTAAEIAADIRPTRKMQMRTLLAIVIVAPVRLAQRCWPWLAVNAGVGVVSLPIWFDHPKWLAPTALALNVAGAFAWGWYRAYRWADRELDALDKRIEP